MTWLLLWATEHRGITSGPSGRFFLTAKSQISKCMPRRRRTVDPKTTPITDDEARLAVMSLMVLLYRGSGIREIHVGGLMRILGIPNEQAAQHDSETVVMDDEFAGYVEKMVQSVDPSGPQPTLH